MSGLVPAFLVLFGFPGVKETPSVKQPRADALGDPLPEGALRRLGTQRLRHQDAVQELAFTRDGKRLLSQGSDNAWHMWEAASGRELHYFPYGGYSVSSGTLHLELELRINRIQWQREREIPPREVALTADGQYLVETSGKEVKVWHPQRRRELRRFPLKANTGHAAAFSPRGPLLAVADNDAENNLIRLMNVSDGKERPPLRVPDGRKISRLVFSPDGLRLASCEGADIRLYDLTTGRRARLFQGHSQNVEAVVFAADGKRLASLGHDRTIRVWEIDADDEIKKISYEEEKPSAVTFSPDGGKLVVGHKTRVYILDVLSGLQARAWDVPGPISALAFSPDGKTLVTGHSHGDILLWDAVTGKGKIPRDLFLPPMSAVRYDRREKAVVVGGGAEIRRLSLPDEKQILTPLPDAKEAALLALSLDGSRAVWKVTDSPGLHLGDTRKPQPHVTCDLPAEEVYAVEFSPDGRLLATIDRNGFLILWKTASGKELRRWKLFEPERHGFRGYMAFTPDTAMLAFIEGNNVHLLETATGKRRLSFHVRYSPQVLVFSADGRRMATADADAIRLWDTANGRLLHGFICGGGSVHSLAFAGGQNWLASGHDDGTLTLWDTSSRLALQTWKGHRNAVTTLIFPPDGKTLISASNDRTLLVWDTAFRSLPAGVKIDTAQLEQWWQNLAQDDSAVGYQAVVGLLHAPDVEAFLQERLAPAIAVKTGRMEQLLADLDDPRFAVRQKAVSALENLENQAAAAVRAALAKKTSPESVKRLEALLAKLELPPAGPALAQTRAIEVLERRGTTRAGQLLERLAQGAPHARLTHMAASALQRLRARKAPE